MNCKQKNSLGIFYETMDHLQEHIQGLLNVFALGTAHCQSAGNKQM